MAIHKWRDIRAKGMSAEEVRKLDAESLELANQLKTLREAAGLTQEELAERIDVNQSQLSRIEKRDDFLVSTLQRYVEALGGKLEVTAVLRGGKRVKLVAA